MMSGPSSIAAIVPTYNRAHFLREGLDSILAQTRPVDQIIVVNDGSTDDTESIVKSYGDRVTLISKPNGGKSSALNLALARCAADYVWICDDDDIAAPDGLERLAAALDADETVGFAFGTYKVFFDDSSGHRVYFDPGLRMRKEEPSISLNFLEGMFTNQEAMLVRRSLYEKVGPFREDLIRSQDFDMAIRLSRRAKTVSMPKTIFFIRRHDGIRGSLVDSFAAKQSERKWLSYERKILTEVKKNYSLQEFTPTFALNWDATLARRAALLQRAYIFAKRGMWEDVVDDLRQASELSSAPPTTEGLQFAETCFGTAFPWTSVMSDTSWAVTMRHHLKSHGYSARIIETACRPMIWQAKERFKKGNVYGGIQTLRILIGILGWRGTFARLMASLFD